jgi:hypothetical protein
VTAALTGQCAACQSEASPGKLAHINCGYQAQEGTELLRCHISRVENGYTVRSVEALEKFTRGLQVPMHELFFEGEEPPKLSNPPKRKSANGKELGDTGKDARSLYKFRRFLGQMGENERKLLMFMAQKMAKPKKV